MFVYVVTDYQNVEGCEKLWPARVFLHKKDAHAHFEKRKAQILKKVPKNDIMTTYEQTKGYWSILTYGTGNGGDVYTVFYKKVKVK